MVCVKETRCWITLWGQIYFGWCSKHFGFMSGLLLHETGWNVKCDRSRWWQFSRCSGSARSHKKELMEALERLAHTTGDPIQWVMMDGLYLNWNLVPGSSGIVPSFCGCLGWRSFSRYCHCSKYPCQWSTVALFYPFLFPSPQSPQQSKPPDLEWFSQLRCMSLHSANDTEPTLRPSRMRKRTSANSGLRPHPLWWHCHSS